MSAGLLVQIVFGRMIRLWKPVFKKSKPLSICGFVANRSAGQLSSCPLPATEGSGIAANSAELQSGGNNCAWPPNCTSKAPRAGSLIVTNSGITARVNPGRA